MLVKPALLLDSADKTLITYTDEGLDSSGGTSSVTANAEPASTRLCLSVEAVLAVSRRWRRCADLSHRTNVSITCCIASTREWGLRLLPGRGVLSSLRHLNHYLWQSVGDGCAVTPQVDPGNNCAAAPGGRSWPAGENPELIDLERSAQPATSTAVRSSRSPWPAHQGRHRRRLTRVLWRVRCMIGEPGAPNRKWITDFNYTRTWSGFRVRGLGGGLLLAGHRRLACGHRQGHRDGHSQLNQVPPRENEAAFHAHTQVGRR